MKKKRLLSALLAFVLTMSMGVSAYAVDDTSESTSDSTSDSASDDTSSVYESSTTSSTGGEKAEEASKAEDKSSSAITSQTESESSEESASSAQSSDSDKESKKYVIGGTVEIRMPDGLDAKMLKGFEFEIKEKGTNKVIKEVAFNKPKNYQVEYDKSALYVNLKGIKFDVSKRYIVTWGKLPDNEMKFGEVILNGNVIGRNANVDFGFIENSDGTYEMPFLTCNIEYAQGYFLEVANIAGNGEIVKNTAVSVNYRGKVTDYITDNEGKFVMPVYDGDMSMKFTGNNGKGYVVSSAEVDEELYMEEIKGVMQYNLVWDKPYAEIEDGYTGDTICRIHSTIRQAGDTSLSKDYRPTIVLKVTSEDGSNTEVIIKDTADYDVPNIIGKGKCKIEVKDSDNYNVKLSKTTFKADKNVDEVTLTATPKHTLVVHKVVGGKEVQCNYTINNKEFSTQGEYTFEVHPISAYKITDKDTGDSYEVIITEDKLKTIVTFGDNPGVAIDNSASNNNGLEGSNGNPNTSDAIAGALLGLVGVLLIGGGLFYKKKKGISL